VRSRLGGRGEGGDKWQRAFCEDHVALKKNVESLEIYGSVF